MTGPGFSGRVKAVRPRRLHLVMRDATMVEGHVQFGEEQSLVSFLNGRRGGWINMTRARRPKLDEAPGHLIIQAEHIVLASAPDGNAQVTATAASGLEERRVEVVLLGGKTLRGFVAAAPQQRLSDYVTAAGKFIGLARAVLLPEERELGDVALHSGAIELIRDLRSGSPLPEEGSAPEPGA